MNTVNPTTDQARDLTARVHQYVRDKGGTVDGDQVRWKHGQVKPFQEVMCEMERVWRGRDRMATYRRQSPAPGTGRPNLWVRVQENDEVVHDLWGRHYSKAANKVGGRRALGPGYKIVLKTRDDRAAFVWLYQEFGWIGGTPYCMLFRNEGDHLSSKLILHAEAWVAAEGWLLDLGLLTHVSGTATGGDGACFKHAGWKKHSKRTKKGLIVLTKAIEAEAQPARWELTDLRGQGTLI